MSDVTMVTLTSFQQSGTKVHFLYANKRVELFPNSPFTSNVTKIYDAGVVFCGLKQHAIMI